MVSESLILSMKMIFERRAGIRASRSQRRAGFPTRRLKLMIKPGQRLLPVRILCLLWFISIAAVPSLFAWEGKVTGVDGRELHYRPA